MTKIIGFGSGLIELWGKKLIQWLKTPVLKIMLKSKLRLKS